LFDFLALGRPADAAPPDPTGWLPVRDADSLSSPLPGPSCSFAT
jgi:hypothetical protein